MVRTIVTSEQSDFQQAFDHDNATFAKMLADSLFRHMEEIKDSKNFLVQGCINLSQEEVLALSVFACVAVFEALNNELGYPKDAFVYEVRSDKKPEPVNYQF